MLLANFISALSAATDSDYAPQVEQMAHIIYIDMMNGADRIHIHVHVLGGRLAIITAVRPKT